MHGAGSSSHRRGFLYVHHVPRNLGMLQHEHLHGDSLYHAEDRFFDRMMSDWDLRTLDVSSARLFYVPTFAYHVLTNIAFSKSIQHFNALVSARNQSVFNATWSRNQSAHVFWFAGDKGACGVPRGPLFLTHWGLTVPWNYMVHVPSEYRPPPPSELEGIGGDAVPCTLDTDIISPPVERGTDSSLATRLPTTTPEHSDASSSSTACRAAIYELFFAGSPQITSRRSSACANPHAPGPLFPDPLVPPTAKGVWQRCYSQGVRELVFHHHANRSDFCIRRRAPEELFRRARFCLAPSGEGFGNRLSRSMLSGCVPVIIQPHVRQPLDDVLPYEDFSLRFGAEQIPQLPDLLRAVSPAEHDRLRRGVERWKSAFDWSANRGLAYEFVRFSLCMRAGLSCGHLDPRRSE